MTEQAIRTVDDQRRVLRRLDPGEALSLLYEVPFGRVVYVHDGEPDIRPLNHFIDRGEIIVRTHSGAPVLRAIEISPAVVFQADQLDLDHRLGWTVTVNGHAALVWDQVRRARCERHLRPWLDKTNDVVVAIRPRTVAGYRMALCSRICGVTNMRAISTRIPVAADPEHFARLRDSTSLMGDPEALRERFRDEGYVYLRGVLDRQQVLGLRAAYFGQFGPSYLAPGTSPADGIWSGGPLPGLPAHGVPGHPAHTMVRSKLFARFAANPKLERLAEILLDEPEVMRLPRQLLRHYHKGAVASRAHTDFDYLDQGSDQLVTVWIPIGDCPMPTGGLIYLERSHTLDRTRIDALRGMRTGRPGDRRPISDDLEWTRQRLGGRWLYADYQAGDVVLHSPHIVHASLSTTTDTMRLSADIRFTPITVEPDPRWLIPWSGDDGN